MAKPIISTFSINPVAVPVGNPTPSAVFPPPVPVAAPLGKYLTLSATVAAGAGATATRVLFHVFFRSGRSLSSQFVRATAAGATYTASFVPLMPGAHSVRVLAFDNTTVSATPKVARDHAAKHLRHIVTLP